jgi:hypothetical protein
MEKSISKEEKKFISLLKEREELVFQVKISEEAIDFWEGQMKVVFNDIDENDENSWHPNYQHKTEELQDKIRSLMARGKIETRTIDKIEQKCNELDEKVTDFVKDIKELEKVKEIVKKHTKKKN